MAFERKPAAGFFDTSEEIAVTKQVVQEFRPTTVEEIEGRKRKDVEEMLRKQARQGESIRVLWAHENG